MTPEEIRIFLQRMAKIQKENYERAAISRSQRAQRHKDYRDMGFDVDTDGILRTLPYIDTTSRFVDVDQDFYDRT